MRLIFMGTPDFATPTLQALIDSKHEILAVYTQPPRPAGRGHKMQKSAVHLLAENNNLPVKTPTSLTAETLQPCDAIVVVAYGLLLPQVVLTHAPCINIHPSALPRWRGAAPIQHSILSGDTTTEICIMQLDEGMDTGPVYLRKKFDINKDETTGELHNRMAIAGAPLLLEVLNSWPVTPTPQAETGICLAPKITPNMRPINWNLPAQKIHNQIRAFSPWPTATCTHNGTTLKILQSTLAKGSGKEGEVLEISTNSITVACKTGAIMLRTIQRPNKKPLPVSEFIKGYEIKAGDILT